VSTRKPKPEIRNPEQKTETGEQKPGEIRTPEPENRSHWGATFVLDVIKLCGVRV